ncbi:hypothetical protein FRX31_013391, partial [Thalictrum thalictroides]
MEATQNLFIDSDEDAEIEILEGGTQGQPKATTETVDPNLSKGNVVGQKRPRTKGPIDLFYPPKARSGKLVQTTMDSEHRKKLRNKIAYEFVKW